MSMSVLYGEIEGNKTTVFVSAVDDNNEETLDIQQSFDISRLRIFKSDRDLFLSIVDDYYGGNGPHNHYNQTSYEFDSLVSEIRKL